MRFPTLTAENLSGRRFALPSDFEGEVNVLLLPYEMWQQFEVDTWTPALTLLAWEFPSMRYYELPTLPRYNALIRRYVDGAMRSGIPDHAVRERSITLYLDKAAFRAALALPNEDHTAILLVRRNGEILWRNEGPRTEAKLRDLRQALEHAALDRNEQQALLPTE